MSGIFGGSKQKSQSTQSSQSTSVASNQSGNQAFPMIQQQYATPAADAYTHGLNLSSAMLGNNFDEYKKNTGYDFANSQGTSQLANQYAGRGLFGSGAFGKALTSFGQGLQQSYGSQYLSQLLAHAQAGLGGGQLVSGAGNYSFGNSTANSTSTGQSTGTSTSNNGIGQTLGAAASLAALSDRRAKTNIKKLWEAKKLGIYEYNYLDGSGPYIGVMADEVETHYPDCLGPMQGEYQTVNYGKILEMFK